LAGGVAVLAELGGAEFDAHDVVGAALQSAGEHGIELGHFAEADAEIAADEVILRNELLSSSACNWWGAEWVAGRTLVRVVMRLNFDEFGLDVFGIDAGFLEELQNGSDARIVLLNGFVEFGVASFDAEAEVDFIGGD